MAQSGYTPIQLYYSTTAAAVPVNTNLASGELAINITDGKLYYKDNTGTVKLLAGATAGPAGGSNTQVQFNSSGVLAGSANMTFNGTTLTVNDLTDSSLTAGRVTYAGTAGNLVDSANLTFNGTILTAAGFAGPINGTVGATTANTGAFTTLSASGTTTLSGNQIISVTDNTNAALRITQLGTGNAILVEDEANPDATPFIVDANGSVAIGSTTASERFNLVSDGRNFLQLTRASDNSAPSVISFRKARGTNASPTIIQNGDTSGEFQYYGYDGVAYNLLATIAGASDGTPGVNDMPGRLVFSTTADGASSPTERFRIASTGAWGLTGANYGTSGQVLTSGGSGAAPTWTTVGGGGGGDVVGPSSATDNALVRFDTTTGKLIQNSVGILSDAGSLSGLIALDTTGAITITKSSAIILGLASAAAQVSSTGTIAISSDGLGAGADTRSGFMFTGRNTSGTIVNILELSGATGATVTKSLGVGATTPSTSGFGITFPATQSASSDANTLDDYEEGTWTPTIGGTATYSGRSGNYVKIGRVVYIDFYIEVNVIGTGSTTLMTGAPFTCSNTIACAGSTTYQANLATSVVSIGALFSSSTSIRFDNRTAASDTAGQGAVFKNGTAIYGSITYLTTA